MGAPAEAAGDYGDAGCGPEAFLTATGWVQYLIVSSSQLVPTSISDKVSVPASPSQALCVIHHPWRSSDITEYQNRGSTVF